MLNRTDLSRIDLNLLVVFEAVMDARNVARAAEKLRLSPSAVSHGLIRLRRLLNDPLFLRTPRGVVPTDRAAELAAPVGEVLGRVRALMATADPFDPTTSTRRFTIGAPDGVSSVLLPSLLNELNGRTSGIYVGLRQLLPSAGETSPERAWRGTFADLEARTMDAAIIPSREIPPRFYRATLFDEDFVITVRAGHRFIKEPTLEHYCTLGHLIVSMSGDGYGFVDEALARQDRARRVVLTVPNFMFALAVLSETDLVCALPRRFVAMHATRFNVVAVRPPLTLGSYRLHAVCLASGMMDPGLRWLMAILEQAGKTASEQPHVGSGRRRRRAG